MPWHSDRAAGRAPPLFSCRSNVGCQSGTRKRATKKFKTFPGNREPSHLQEGMIAKHVLNIGRLLTKIAIAIPLIVEVGRRCLKARRQPRRSTKPADGLTSASFDWALTKRITFRDARKQLERSAATSKAQSDQRDPHLERELHVALKSLTPVLSVRAGV